jgi:putative DNA primase/helicase
MGSSDVKPMVIHTPDLSHVPTTIASHRRWVLWRQERRDGTWTKIPYRWNVDRPASSTDPETWGTLDDVSTRYLQGGYTGLGYVLGDGVTGVDLDHVRDPDTGDLTTEAQDILRRLDSYSEVSVGAHGVHVLLLGAMPVGGKRRGHIEMYSEGRYFTYSGMHIEGTPTDLQERQIELNALHASIFSYPPEVPTPTITPIPSIGISTLSDEELISRVQNLSGVGALWTGEIGEYGSRSEADLALVNAIAFYAGADTRRIDFIFRQSGLMRPKWDERRGEKTYGELTCIKAVQGRKQFFAATKDEETAIGIVDRGPSAKGSRPLTDLGNAERLIDDCGGNLRYCTKWRKWLIWDGTRWSRDSEGQIWGLAYVSARRILQEAEEEEDEALAKSLRKWALLSQGHAHLIAMIVLAQGLPGIPVSPDDLDSDIWALNTPTGTVSLRSGVLHPHRREDLITRCTRVGPDSSVSCIRWLRFLDEVMGGRREIVEFLRRVMGYSLCGDTRERRLLILHGLGRNGKSTLLTTIHKALGEYSAKTAANTFVSRGNQTNDLARLAGVRLVFASETGGGKKLDEGIVKELTGNEPITARFLYAEPFEFRPQFSAWISTNCRPEIDASDPAIWDRICLVPFDVRMGTAGAPAEDKMLSSTLETELPGILAWMISGCVDWISGGLKEPSVVLAATQDYRDDEDRLADFFDVHTTTLPGLRVSARDLYQAYLKWAQSLGISPQSATSLGRAVRARGGEACRTNSLRGWIGIGLRVTGVTGW